jgi:hypothetical protein
VRMVMVDRRCSRWFPPPSLRRATYPAVKRHRGEPGPLKENFGTYLHVTLGTGKWLTKYKHEPCKRKLGRGGHAHGLSVL